MEETFSLGFSKAVFFIHLAATWFLVGVIWFVQLIHYPLFSRVGVDGFRLFNRREMFRAILIYGFPMTIEITTGILLVWYRLPGIMMLQVWINLILLMGIWGISLVLHLPKQLLLFKSVNLMVVKKIVLFNWFRTVGWTLRGALMIWIIDSILFYS